LRPHRPQDFAEISRFAAGFSLPLLAVRAGKEQPSGVPLLSVHPADVLVSSIGPGEEGGSMIVRLFGASGQLRRATLRWGDRKPKRVFLSDTGEGRGKAANEPIEVPGFGLVTLRVDW
jgi:hypothetical protein